MWIEMSNTAILQEIGRRFKELRLQRGIQQKTLGEIAGVSTGSIIRFEKGEPMSTENLIKVMRAMNLLNNLEQLIPEQPISPLLLKKLQKKVNKRVSG